MKLGIWRGDVGKYCFDGKWYKPRWLCHSGKMSIPEMKVIAEEAYSSGTKYQKAILVAGQSQWEKISSAGFSSWCGLVQLHMVDYSQEPIGSCADWAKDFQAYAGLLIHEYEAADENGEGKVAFLADFSKIYTFMVDTSAPEDYQQPEATEETEEPAETNPYTILEASPVSYDVDLKVLGISIKGTISPK